MIEWCDNQGFGSCNIHGVCKWSMCKKTHKSDAWGKDWREQTRINTDVYSDYHADFEECQEDTKSANGNTVETPEETSNENQSSKRLNNVLEESTSSSFREHPKRNVRPPQRLDLIIKASCVKSEWVFLLTSSIYFVVFH